MDISYKKCVIFHHSGARAYKRNGPSEKWVLSAFGSFHSDVFVSVMWPKSYLIFRHFLLTIWPIHYFHMPPVCKYIKSVNMVNVFCARACVCVRFCEHKIQVSGFVVEWDYHENCWLNRVYSTFISYFAVLNISKERLNMQEKWDRLHIDLLCLWFETDSSRPMGH